jgi:hypothetical protein
MTQLTLAQQSTQTTTEALNNFLEQYNIKYVYNPQGTAYYIAQDLSSVVDKDKEDFGKHFIRLPHIREYLENNSIRLLGQESLKQFKTAYIEQLGPLPDSIKFTSKLYVCTSEVANTYINYSKTEAQRLYNSIHLDATNKQVIQENLDTSNNPTNNFFTREIELHIALAYLSTLGNYRLRSEESVADITSNKQKVRRLDMVNVKYSKGKKIVTIYELKANSITLDILTENLNKHYLELARCHYKTPYVKLVYIAPNSPEQAALDLLAYSPDVSIMLLKDFTNMLLVSAAKRHKSDTYFTKKLLPESFPIKQLLF